MQSSAARPAAGAGGESIHAERMAAQAADRAGARLERAAQIIFFGNVDETLLGPAALVVCVGLTKTNWVGCRYVQ
jgi:hypothetical protein